MSSDQNFVCTREGKVVGPFNKAQLTEMRNSGSIYSYFWVWEAENPQWSPIAAPPPPPQAAQAQATPTQAGAMPAQTPAASSNQAFRQYPKFDEQREMSSSAQYHTPGFDDEEDEVTERTIPTRPRPGGKKKVQPATDGRESRFAVVAFDKRHVINGQIQQPTGSGALFYGPAPRDQAGGPFVRGNRIRLSIFDSKTGKSENVDARIVSTMRRGNTWELRLLWTKIPEMLEAA